MARTEQLDRRRVVVGTLALLAAAVTPAAAEGATPEAFIDDVGRRTVAVLMDPSYDRAGKLANLAKLLDEAIDLETVSRLVMGKYWRDASPAQREEYQKMFRALAIKAMADRLGDYGNQTYEIVDSRKIDDRDSVVSVKIRQPDGKSAISVDWRVRDLDGRLGVIDIIAEGVSMVVTQRSEVAEVAGRNGVAGVLNEMRNRLQRPS